MRTNKLNVVDIKLCESGGHKDNYIYILKYVNLVGSLRLFGFLFYWQDFLKFI